MTEDRLVDLETRLAYQDQLVETLNNLVYEQDKRVQKLEMICKRLSRNINEMAENSTGADDDDQPPPHY